MVKERQKTGEFVYGIHPLLEVLKAKRRKVITIYTTKPTPKSWEMIEPYLPSYPVNYQYVTRDVVTKIAQTTDHQGVVALVQPFPFRKKFFDPAKQPLLVMLDGIQDTRNMGAILRSAYCTGFNGVIITKRNSAPLNAAALKASAGLAEHMEIYMAASAQEAVQELRKSNYHVYLATFGGKDATQIAYEHSLCMVIGGEGFGISKEILKSGTQITIPQKTADISYNASVAAGILLFLVSSKQKVIGS